MARRKGFRFDSWLPNAATESGESSDAAPRKLASLSLSVSLTDFGRAVPLRLNAGDYAPIAAVPIGTSRDARRYCPKGVKCRQTAQREVGGLCLLREPML